MRIFDVRDFGAVPDTGEVCTAAVQAAIDAAEGVKGAQVLVSEGTYTVGTLFLHSDMDLRLDPGAVLKASGRLEDYPDFDPGFFDRRKAPRAMARCLIFAGRCENLSVSGRGTIDCNGSAFCRKVPGREFIWEVNYERISTETPPRMLFCMSCENLSLTDFTMREMAGGWGVWINDCSYVEVRGVKMRCNRNYPNADGIHVNCSSDVTISDCVLHTGDDSIILRSNCNTLPAPRACERVTIKGCVLSSKCTAIRVVWRGDYAVRDCVVSDVVVESAYTAVGINLPEDSNPTDVGPWPTVVERLRFSNFVVRESYESPINLRVAEGNPYGSFRDITFSGFDCRGAALPIVEGRHDAIIRDVHFDHCVFRAANFRGLMPTFRFCENVTLDACSFSEDSAPKLNWLFENPHD